MDQERQGESGKLGLPVGSMQTVSTGSGEIDPAVPDGPMGIEAG